MPANSVFSLDSVSQAKYGYERVWYNFTASAVAPLTPGLNQVFDVSAWNTDDQIEKVVVLDRIAATHNAGIRLVWSYDGAQSDTANGWTDALPAGMRPWKPNILAKNRLALFIDNQTGANVTSFNLNYAVTVRNVTVADDILLGFTPSEADMETVAKLPTTDSIAALTDAINKTGAFPIDFQRTFDFLIRNRMLPDNPAMVPFHLIIPAGAAFYAVSAFRSIPVSAGEVHIIRGVAMEGTPAVNLIVNRDGQQGYLALTGTSFLQADDAPWDVIVPYTKQINIAYQSLTTLASATSYPGRLDISRYKLSDLLKLHLRLTKVPAVNYEKVIAGWQ